jgi:hypothetical protein
MIVFTLGRSLASTKVTLFAADEWHGGLVRWTLKLKLLWPRW